MSFGITAFSQAPFGGAGESDVDVTPTSVVATLSLGTLTYEGSANVTLTSLVSTLSLGTTQYTGSANVSATSTVATLSLGTPTYEGSANVSATSVVATLSLGTTQYTGSANVDPTSLVATSSLGTTSISIDKTVSLAGAWGYDSAFYDADYYDASGFTLTTTLASLSGVIGNANVVIDAVPSTLSLGNISVIGTANVAIDSVSLTGTLSNENLILVLISDDSYHRSRTVYVDYRDNYLNSTISVEEQNRVVQIPERPYQVQPNILKAA